MLGSGIGGFPGEPFFQTSKKIVRGQPVRSEGETALGMIGGAQAVEAPEGFRQGETGKPFPIAPPKIPDLPEIFFRAGGSMRREKTGHSQKACLPGERCECGLPEFRQGFGEAQKRPGIVFVTQGAKEAFPEGVFPSGVAGPGLQLGAFALQPDQGGLAEQFGNFRRPEIAQRRAALPGQ